MSNEMYPLSRQAFADGDLDWSAADWRIALVDATYVYSDAHDFYTDLGASVIVASANLTGKTNVLGVCDASDVVFARSASASMCCWCSPARFGYAAGLLVSIDGHVCPVAATPWQLEQSSTCPVRISSTYPDSVIWYGEPATWQALEHPYPVVPIPPDVPR